MEFLIVVDFPAIFEKVIEKDRSVFFFGNFVPHVSFFAGIQLDSKLKFGFIFSFCVLRFNYSKDFKLSLHRLNNILIIINIPQIKRPNVDAILFFKSFHSLPCLSDHLLVLAEGKPDVLLSQFLVLLCVKWRTWNCNNALLICQLDGKRVILCSWVSVVVCEVFFVNFDSGNIGNHEITTLWNP